MPGKNLSLRVYDNLTLRLRDEWLADFKRTLGIALASDDPATSKAEKDEESVASALRRKLHAGNYRVLAVVRSTTVQRSDAGEISEVQDWENGMKAVRLSIDHVDRAAVDADLLYNLFIPYKFERQRDEAGEGSYEVTLGEQSFYEESDLRFFE